MAERQALIAGIVGISLFAGGIWYFMVGNRIAPIIATAPAPTEAAHLSIVVLPFTNLSGGASQDYFTDGITENLTTDLSRIRKSFVIARNTTNEARRAEWTVGPQMRAGLGVDELRVDARYAENMWEARGFFERALALDLGNLEVEKRESSPFFGIFTGLRPSCPDKAVPWRRPN